MESPSRGKIYAINFKDSLPIKDQFKYNSLLAEFIVLSEVFLEKRDFNKN